ncbi:MAG: GIY-YIG nuclease family protein [Chitinophagaceae bacterium]|nr:GIY-YIG nuclease family protein [Chitinophagaceae bacterium]
MYAIVDIETTGGHASSNGITEISIFIHDGERVVKHFTTLINPLQIIPRYITTLTGINNDMVKDAPVFEEIAPVIFDLLQDKIFVAHNVNFDYSFIKHHLKQADFELAVKKLCTVRLSRKVFPGLASYSLGNLCRSLDVVITNRHRADGDARATVLLWEKMLANDGKTHMQEMLKKSSGEQWLPLYLSRDAIKDLPDKPGVYSFYNSKDKIIYVGKGINIRKRVSSHFTHNSPDRKRQNFLRNVCKVTYKQCATELEAIVLESTEIKRLWPVYNLSQKQPAQKFGLYLFEDGKGYYRLAIDKKKKHLPSLYNFNLLHEGLVLLKKMIQEFGLNEKLCHIDKTPFYEQDFNALEPVNIYNTKVKLAIDTLQTQLPTFVVVDNGITANDKLCLLMEKGSFWGMGYLPLEKEIKDIAELKNILNPYTDNDTIRNSIYSFVASYPEKQIMLS